ncbi:hypothetical protein CYLTODRAFT_168696 [Cylindrobasidium torrendii FP15055 ss-10]|uniref:Purple acid phosphatase N-terminal domain-containing protein n=1 Tax=Cylindrobasidium torrendii FP15055 ss-10 TaxID=1314674 RepID=A0A0D7BJU5_9AGAR|nr:hypothetical protein CYLTODRAFT_168696 [Cylindrobasidium torrendii FP15055 ss-10]
MMMMNSLFTTFMLMLFSFVSAVPLNTLRDVWVPKITSPVSGTVWTVGETVEVTWSTADTPVYISNGGRIGLGRDDRIIADDALIRTFDLREANGAINVTVPEVEAGDDYFIVLFGDSGNWSDKFTIQA